MVIDIIISTMTGVTGPSVYLFVPNIIGKLWTASIIKSVFRIVLTVLPVHHCM